LSAQKAESDFTIASTFTSRRAETVPIRVGFLRKEPQSLKKPGSALLQPAVSAFIIAPSACFGRLFDSEDPVLFQWAGQVVLISGSGLNPTVQVDPALTPKAWKHLFQWIDGLLKLRRAKDESVIELAPEAAQAFVEFWHRQFDLSPSLAKPERRFAENAPIVAAKLAGTTHLLSPNRLQPLPGPVMAKAVAMAERLSTDTAKLADILVRQHRDAHLSETAEKMFVFLAEMGRTKPWPLWTRFDKHPKDLMASALDLLIRGGRARPYPDGTLEAIVEATKGTPPSP
jgi:hypothetical protein